MKPIRWSSLRSMGRSPFHYRAALDEPQPETQAMRIGAYVHHLVLGGWRRFEVWDGTRRGKDWEVFRDANQDATILTASETAPCLALARIIMADQRAMSVLEGSREQTLRWQIGGRACEGTPDVIGADFVTDLKITNDASPLRLPWHARRMGWTAQLPWYGDGAIKNGCAIAHHYLVAVEAKWPFPPPVVYELEPDAVEEGRKRYRLLFEQVRVCEDSGEWPGYAQSVVPIYAQDEEFSLQIDGEEVAL